MNLQELRQALAALIEEMEGLIAEADAEERDLSQEEQRQIDEWLEEAEELEEQIDEAEARQERRQRVAQYGEQMQRSAGRQTRQAPNVNRQTGVGDSLQRAMAHYMRTGDAGGLQGEEGEAEFSQVSEGRSDGFEVTWSRELEQRVMNGLRQVRATDTTLNITTGADGGNLVPTGFVPQIVARKNERMLATLVGCRRVPGSGTTVNFPFESRDPAVFAATSEQDDAHAQDYERDAPGFGQKAFTLAKKTKKLELTEELLDDEDASLMEFIGDHIGRAMANTHNSLLLTEVAANGSSLKTFASATAIAAGEPEDIVFDDTLGYYLDDGSNAAWVVRPTTFGSIASITGNDRLYAESPAGSFMRQLLMYPVHYSNNAAAIGAGNKSAYFGDWFYVGYREEPRLRFLRDPYSVDGIVILKYSFRTVYGVLQAGAIGYAEHPTS